MTKKTETRGRPAETGGLYTTPCRVTIDADTRDFLIKIGKGNISAGIRRVSKSVNELILAVKEK